MKYLRLNFNGTQVDIKHDRVKIDGLHSNKLLRSLIDLCTIEYLQKDKVVTETVGEVIYNKKQYHGF